jgi:CBS domain-containing protein
MITVGDLLKTKGSAVWSVAPTTSVLETLKLMAEKQVGALVVLDAGQIVGIISERDFVRSIAKTGMCLIESDVKAYMSSRSHRS